MLRDAELLDAAAGERAAQQVVEARVVLLADEGALGGGVGQEAEEFIGRERVDRDDLGFVRDLGRVGDLAVLLNLLGGQKVSKIVLLIVAVILQNIRQNEAERRITERLAVLGVRVEQILVHLRQSILKIEV